MEKLGKILLVGMGAGLVVSVWGSLSHLLLTPFAPAQLFFKKQGFELVVLTFGLNLILGFFYVAAYALTGNGRPGPRWRRILSFWGLLLLVGAAPRALIVYRYFPLPDEYVVGWAVSWAIEAALVAILVTFLWPRTKGVFAKHESVPS